MTEVKQQILCGKCGVQLPVTWISDKDGRDPCEKCGSVERNIIVTAHEKLEIETYDLIKLKRWSNDSSIPSKKRLRKETISGYEKRVSQGDWVKKIRVIDRDNDLYIEKIVVKKTGEVIRDVCEPLKQHQEHGSAKKK